MEQSFNGSAFGDASYLANPMHSDWGAYADSHNVSDDSEGIQAAISMSQADQALADAARAFSNPNKVPLPLLKKGATDAQLQQSLGIRNLIRRVQQTLVDGMLFLPSDINGIFDEKTAKAVEAWQTQAKIGVDGKVGPETYKSFGYSDKAAQVDKKKAASISSPIVTEEAAPLAFYKRRNVQIGMLLGVLTIGTLVYVFLPRR